LRRPFGAQRPAALPSLRRSITPSLQGCSRGFTLLEMTMVLFIMAIFISVAAFSFQGLTDEQILRTPAAELQRMAREAVSRAGIYEQPETIVFDKTGFGIRYRADASSTAGGNTQYWLRRVQTPPEMRLLMKRWGQNKWIPAAGERWMALPSGICEPLAVRLEWGRSFTEMQFHPLTGGVAEESTYVAP
jgi:prepilin-type N-terminal cleavage/methylation domain-containing protein